MIVFVGPDAGAVVGDTDDLTRLHVEAAADDVGADAALRASGLGYLEDDHAWLSITALREHAGGAADWPARYQAMISYATGKGWCSSDGSHVRAHVERKHGKADV